MRRAASSGVTNRSISRMRGDVCTVRTRTASGDQAATPLPTARRRAASATASEGGGAARSSACHVRKEALPSRGRGVPRAPSYYGSAARASADGRRSCGKRGVIVAAAAGQRAARRPQPPSSFALGQRPSRIAARPA